MRLVALENCAEVLHAINVNYLIYHFDIMSFKSRYLLHKNEAVRRFTS